MSPVPILGRDTCRLVLHLIQQAGCVGFQFEAVGGLDQSDFLMGYYILIGNVLADDGKNLGSRQFLALPLLGLFSCRIVRRFLVTELGDKSRCLVDMFVQVCVGVQFVHILGKFVLEQFQAPPCQSGWFHA